MKQPSDIAHLSIDDLFYKNSSGSLEKKYIIIRPVFIDLKLQDKLKSQCNALTSAGFQFYSYLLTNIALDKYTLEEASEKLGKPIDQILILNQNQQEFLCKLKLDDIKLYQPFRDIQLHARMSRELVEQLLNQHGDKIESLTIDVGFDLSNLPKTSNLSAVKKLNIMRGLSLEDEQILLPHLIKMTAIEELSHKQGINCSDAFKNFVGSLNHLMAYHGCVISTIMTEQLKCLHLDAHESDSETIQALMDRITTLDELSIFNCPKYTEVSLARLTITQSLDVECRIDLPSRSNLTRLSVLELTLTELFIPARHRYTCRLPELKALFIQNIAFLPPLDLAINLIPKMNGLETLHIAGNSDKDFKFLKVMLQVAPNLKELFFILNKRRTNELLSLNLPEKIKTLVKDCYMTFSNQDKSKDTVDTDNRYMIFSKAKPSDEIQQNGVKTIGHGK